MGTCKALILAGAAVIGPAAAALAADLPPPPMIEAPPPVEADIGGWYLRGDVGVGSYENADLRSSFDGVGVTGQAFNHSSISDAAFGGGGVGYQWNSWLRFDATGEYRTQQAFNAIESYNCASYGGCQHAHGGFTSPGGDGRAYDRYSGNIQSSVALFNAYLDLYTIRSFTLFAGAGVGVSVNRSSGVVDQALGGAPYVGGYGSYGLGGFGFAAPRTTTSLAWAAMAGISYAVSPTVALELGYRHLDMGEAKLGPINCYASCGNAGRETQSVHLASDDVRLGFRWLFADFAPVAYPAPPIVRKD